MQRNVTVMANASCLDLESTEEQAPGHSCEGFPWPDHFKQPWCECPLPSNPDKGQGRWKRSVFYLPAFTLANPVATTAVFLSWCQGRLLQVSPQTEDHKFPRNFPGLQLQTSTAETHRLCTSWAEQLPDSASQLWSSHCWTDFSGCTDIKNPFSIHTHPVGSVPSENPD